MEKRERHEKYGKFTMGVRGEQAKGLTVENREK